MGHAFVSVELGKGMEVSSEDGEREGWGDAGEGLTGIS